MPSPLPEVVVSGQPQSRTQAHSGWLHDSSSAHRVCRKLVPAPTACAWEEVFFWKLDWTTALSFSGSDTNSGNGAEANCLKESESANVVTFLLPGNLPYSHCVSRVPAFKADSLPACPSSDSAQGGWKSCLESIKLYFGRERGSKADTVLEG